MLLWSLEYECHLVHLFLVFQRVYPSRSPSPPMPEYGSYDPLYPLGGAGFHHSKPPPPPTSSYGGGSRQRGITTATSMIISNLSDTVSKNDVAVSPSYSVLSCPFTNQNTQYSWAQMSSGCVQLRESTICAHVKIILINANQGIFK